MYKNHDQKVITGTVKKRKMAMPSKFKSILSFFLNVAL